MKSQITYQNQKTWKDIMSFLPESLHLKEEELPLEDLWEWKGNQIHIDRYENSNSPFKIILHHGVGTNARQMSLLIGSRLAKNGYSVIAPDNLGYGMTQVNQSSVKYHDWIELLSDLINEEIQRDGKPVVLYGLSAGGMIAYHATCKNPKVKGIIGMTFLDARIFRVRKETGLIPLMAFLAPSLILMGKVPILKKIKVPIKWLVKMYTLANNKEALKVFLRDKTSAGSLVSLEFMSTFMTYKPEIEAVDFNVCPILLTQPEKDRWTPEHLSKISLDGIQARFETKILENAGHYPLEQPGIDQLEKYILEFIKTLE